MKKRVLDSSILISYWNQSRSRRLEDNTEDDARTWARRVIQIHDSNVIATPVYIEVIAGTMNAQASKLTRAYMGQFRCIDQGIIPPADWQEARRLAARISRRGPTPRDLGDCLIRAIANRFRHEVVSADQSFPD